jgi:ankyrin repeat protein
MPVASCRKRPAAEISESGYEDDFYIESLTFPQAQFRLEEISSAHEKTCEWIRGRPEYLKWMSEESLPSHGGFFWIKGKPGAGKSTIMKYLLLNGKKGLRDTVILSFFFHAQGTLLERSVMGMYRSLLHQLLCSTVPADAKNTFLNVAKRLELQDGNPVWAKRDVKNLLSLTIKSLQQYHILFLIDAVDECDQAEVEDMTTFFQELGKSAVEQKVYLRICLASRHYPHITLDKGIELIVEDQQEHEEDLRKYVETKLKGGRSSLIQCIRNNIRKRADGVFLWVMLVVRSLNEAFDRGNIGALQKRLDEIPNGLDNLFTDILTRDQKDIHVLIFSLQLILFGRRTLRRDEFYFAALFEKTNVIEAYIDPELHSTTVMDRLLLDVTKGLAETAKQSYRSKPPEVRFIHESVRDFLLRRNGLTIIQSQRNDSTSFIGVSHDCLKQFCFDYISGVFQSCQLCSGKKSLVLRDTLQGEGKDGSIQKAFPFLDYAIRNVLEHSDLAQAEDISQKEFLSAYSNRFSDFKLVFNAVEKISVRHHKDDWSLLYVMAHSDLSHLIQVQLLGESHACDLGGLYLCPMGAAFHNGNMASVRALLGLQPNSRSESLNVAPEPEMVSRMKQFFIELDGHKKLFATKNWKRQRLLSLALKGKCVSILRLLLFTNIIDFNDTLGFNKGTPLIWSILNREPGLVEFLVSEVKVNLQAPIKKADSIKKPLLKAAFSSNTELRSRFEWKVADRRILDILLRQDSLYLVCQDEKGMNAIHWAALADDEFSLKCLIKRGFDYEHCDSTGRDPLSYAAEYGHVNIVKALLEIEGIEVDRCDQSGRAPLTWVVAANGEYPIEQKKSVVEQLFRTNRVDFNSRDRNLHSPLASAVRGCSPGGVEVLLNFGSVDVNSRDLCGRTPLITAAIYGDTTIIKCLLRCDRIDVDAQDNDGRTALSWLMGPLNFPGTMKGCVSASFEELGSYTDAAKLLLASRTPDIDLADIWGHTPAWWEKAYKIVLAELGGSRHRKKLTARPFLLPLLEDSHSPPGLAALAQYMESETIKSEMQRFLDGEAVLESRVRFDLQYQNVKFGTDSVLEGTEIKTSIRLRLD